MRAIDAHQTLGDDAVERSHQIERIDPDVQHAADHIEHAVGVHGGEHQMAGERGLDRDLRGFAVANFADHDLVGIMAQDGTQAAREGQAALFVDGNLDDAAQLIFDRIFDRDDLVAAGIHFGQRGVQRGGLARPRGAGHEQHAVRQARQAAQTRDGGRIETQRFKAQPALLVGQAFLVEDAQHRVFAMHGRHDGHAQINVARIGPHQKAAVLRHPALGDVEIGEHLDARNHLLGGGAVVDAADRVEHTVHTVFDGHAVRIAFEVNVAGLDLERVIQQGIDETHDRVVVFGDAAKRQFLDLRGFRLTAACQMRQFGLDRAQRAFMPLEIGADFIDRRERERERRCDARFDAIDEFAIERIVECEAQVACRGAHKNDLQAFCIGEREQIERRLARLQIGTRKRGHAQRRRATRERLMGRQAQLLREQCGQGRAQCACMPRIGGISLRQQRRGRRCAFDRGGRGGRHETESAS